MSFNYIIGAPYITNYTAGIVVLEGKRVSLVCNATNDIDAMNHDILVQVSWYNGTEVIKPDGKHVIINNKRSNVTDQMHSVLSFDPVNYTDHGEYVCRAFNHPLSFTERRIKLTVECELHTVYSCKHYVIHMYVPLNKLW